MDKLGDLFMFSPNLLPIIDDNPFEAPQRSLPVEFVVPQSHTFSLTVNVDPAFSLDDKPQNMLVQLPGNQYYRRLIGAQGQTIQVQTKLNRSRVIFTAEEYPVLKEMYDLMANSEEDVLVFKRHNE